MVTLLGLSQVFLCLLGTILLKLKGLERWCVVLPWKSHLAVMPMETFSEQFVVLVHEVAIGEIGTSVVGFHGNHNWCTGRRTLLRGYFYPSWTQQNQPLLVVKMDLSCETRLLKIADSGLVIGIRLTGCDAEAKHFLRLYPLAPWELIPTYSISELLDVPLVETCSFCQPFRGYWRHLGMCIH